MSENKVQNEQELWDVLSSPVSAESKAEAAPKAQPKNKEGRFAKPGPVKEVPKEGRKLDGFFYACMAGVAAVSVAATLVLGGMLGNKAPAGEQVPGPVETNPPIVETADGRIAELELENAELRAQLELQKDQIKKLQAELLDLTNGTAELPTVSTEPGAQDDLVSAQLEAYEIFNQIKDAYTEFDRAKLEELIPQMDGLVNYLSSEAMNEYYLILEYVEQPSNG